MAEGKSCFSQYDKGMKCEASGIIQTFIPLFSITYIPPGKSFAPDFSLLFVC